ncbi:hypothetical protein SAPIO_CDS0032 [Scedosporium apiospermum]|uniref:26S proteasome complex subunit SEM1 n=1 Tax=Pseudallescheria apiosperma TaxID=563466 RepID=A0A084GHD9_PSEDA|nr:uncharacterized protein SAPIO_CDS0032 [Scedosporium apiospermum]KEZ46751.1 hypothetical protein SAPIO_CDS0032 [Scedosporium apiospermum]
MASADTKPTTAKPTEETKAEEPQKPAAIVGEDDEFEDFPVDDWATEDAEAAEGAETKHLWEESWDDDDTSDDFSAQLKEEIRKVEASKKR